MTTITFNTLRFANRLKQAGISSEHAEAEAEALADVFETNIAELVTKADLAALELRMKADLAALELRMTIKFGAMIVVAIGAVAAIVKML